MKVISILLVASALAFTQTIVGSCPSISAEAAKKQFDVASVKPAEPPKPPTGLYSPANNPFAMTGGPGTNDPGRFTAAHASLSTLILRAWGLDPDQLKAPSWLNSPGGYAINATMPASTTQEEFCGMLRNLLAERFHFKFHFEKQPRPGYELTVMPAGPKFKEFVPGPAAPGSTQDGGPGRDSAVDPFAAMRALGSDANGFPNLSPSKPTGMATNSSRTGATKLTFRNNMAEFARRLAGIINLSNGVPPPGTPVPRVVDKTGLAGIYEIRVEYAGIPFPVLGQDSAPAPAPPDPVAAGPSIFTAVQQQLGLKLTKIADIQVDVMIVAHIDQTPTEN